LISKHNIDNYEYLEKYVNFFYNYSIGENINYTEKHHILPVSVFPEFKNDIWNIIEISYEDHKLCHLWLFKSINIRKYQRPLNWMLSTYKNKEEISNASKKGWENLKMNNEKYNDWCRKRSDCMKKLSTEEQRRRANIFWKNISDGDYLKFSKIMKEYWTEEKKINKSKQMNEYYLDPKNIEKKRIESKNRWNSMTNNERESFSEKMTLINKDEDKRKDAGDKIKELWKNKDYLEKMNNRKHRSGRNIKIIKQTGEEIIFDNMRKLENEYKFSAYLIRKYIDTDIQIEEIDLKDNKLLLNCKIESV
jgi:ACT domain-containing protein